MANKRGELAWNMIILAIIALLVLGVVSYIFWNQMKARAKDYSDLGEQASSDNCETWWTVDRRCSDSAENAAGEKDKYIWEQIYPREGEWADCGIKKSFEDKPNCYERTSELDTSKNE